MPRIPRFALIPEEKLENLRLFVDCFSKAEYLNNLQPGEEEVRKKALAVFSSGVRVDVMEGLVLAIFPHLQPSYIIPTVVAMLNKFPDIQEEFLDGIENRLRDKIRAELEQELLSIDEEYENYMLENSVDEELGELEDVVIDTPEEEDKEKEKPKAKRGSLK